MTANGDDKLDQLVEDFGYESLEVLLEAAVMDTVCPGICMNPGCDYTCETEPDQDRGWCEACGEGTVRSAMWLAGVI